MHFMKHSIVIDGINIERTRGFKGRHTISIISSKAHDGAVRKAVEAEAGAGAGAEARGHSRTRGDCSSRS
jgi:hypothetical protein